MVRKSKREQGQSLVEITLLLPILIILFLGMAYEWRKGDLEWARPKIEKLDLNKL